MPGAVAVAVAAAPDADGTAGLGACAPSLRTKNECPHFEHRILRPAGGTRRSSI
jgi:hypothetical protein